MTSTTNILRLDASARKSGSVTRSLADEAIEHLTRLSAASIFTRDVADGLPFVDFRRSAGIEKFSAESRIPECALLQDRLPRAGSAILET